MNYAHEMKQARVELRFKLPGEIDATWFAVTFGEPESKCFAPLHRDHDVPFMPHSKQMALETIRQREHAVQGIAQVFARKIMEHLAAQDPRNGYSAAENRKFYEAKPAPGPAK